MGQRREIVDGRECAFNNLYLCAKKCVVEKCVEEWSYLLISGLAAGAYRTRNIYRHADSTPWMSLVSEEKQSHCSVEGEFRNTYIMMH